MEPAWLDGNAVAGLLAEALGEEMTVVERECGDCGDRGRDRRLPRLPGRGRGAALPRLWVAGAARGRADRGLQRQLGTPGSGPSTVTVPVATPSV